MQYTFWLIYITVYLAAFGSLWINSFSHDYLNELFFCFFMSLSFVIFPVLNQYKPPQKLIWILAVALMSLRLIAISSPSFYEDDHFRYLVEARLLDHQHDPYTTSPKDAQQMIKEGSLVLSKTQRNQFYNLAEHSGFGGLSAIYPPIVIQLFRLTNNAQQLGYLFLFCELLILGFLAIQFKSQRSFLWAWWLHPLPIVEVYLNKHYDLWIGLAILIAVCSINARRYKIAITCLSLAVHFKGFAMIFIPFFKPRIILGFTGFYCLIELFSAIYFPTRFLPQSSLEIFVTQWEFNNGLYTWTRILFQSLQCLNQPELFVRYLFFLFLIASILVVYLKPNKQSKFIRVSLFFFLLSPVTNPWYFLMSLPFFLTDSMDRRELHFFSLCPMYYYLWISSDPMQALPWTTPVQLSVILYLLVILPNRSDYGQQRTASIGNPQSS